MMVANICYVQLSVSNFSQDYLLLTNILWDGVETVNYLWKWRVVGNVETSSDKPQVY